MELTGTNLSVTVLDSVENLIIDLGHHHCKQSMLEENRLALTLIVLSLRSELGAKVSRVHAQVALMKVVEMDYPPTDGLI